MNTTQSYPALQSLPDGHAAETVTAGLLPNARLTRALVESSALERIGDLRAIAAVVMIDPSLAMLRERWQCAMYQFDNFADERKLQVASSPIMRRWLHRAGRAVLEDTSAEFRVSVLACVGNYCVGLPLQASGSALLRSHDGVIETWDCKRYLTLPHGQPPADWLVKFDGCRVILQSPINSCIPLIAKLLTCESILPKSEVAVNNCLPSLRVRLDETKAPERDAAVLATIDDRVEAYPAGKFRAIAEAATLLSDCWSAEYDDLKTTLHVVVPRIAPTNWRMDGFTLSNAQGAVWINPSDLTTTFESLVHEHSHVKLRYLEEAVPILESIQSMDRFSVGWRTDSRPIIGLYEGVYVHIHCALAFQRALQGNFFPESLRDSVAIRLKELICQASQAFTILQGNARFTPPGMAYLVWAEAQLKAFH